MTDLIWQTIAVTALPPGWFNAFKDEDGHIKEYPCPAILVQEQVQDGDRGRGPRYGTRAVFGHRSESGHIDPAADDFFHGYVGTYGPGEDLPPDLTTTTD